MRVTVHLDGFEQIAPCSYAIVWIDKESGTWSREGHAGVRLPQWGRCRSIQGAALLVSEPEGTAICQLDGLDLTSDVGPFEGEHGEARWPCTGPVPIAGHWHVQCIDPSTAVAEDSLFADDDASSQLERPGVA
ncbi:DUF3564 family protein [Paraburkholderia ferrariae]|uniref:DUF3564 family protein n=1 Tax=Paraburkholderia ferrariae TaxID=386056 RepID=UPI0005A78BBC|nr:DUF3564 family protein [Paraburkholderia ferrariae]